MQPVNLWHQRLSTAVQYLMVRLVPSALSYLLQWISLRTRSLYYTFPLVVIMPDISLANISEEDDWSLGTHKSG